jgi:hypothetical protein
VALAIGAEDAVELGPLQPEQASMSARINGKRRLHISNLRAYAIRLNFQQVDYVYYSTFMKIVMDRKS